MCTSAEKRRKWDSAALFWANDHKNEGGVDRKEVILRFRQDVERSRVLLAQLPDITGGVLVCHCRSSEDCHANGMAFGFGKVVLIGKQGT